MVVPGGHSGRFNPRATRRLRRLAKYQPLKRLTCVPHKGNRLASGVSLAGILASAILHCLLLAPVLFRLGSASQEARDEYTGLGASSSDDPTMTMIWIEDSVQAQMLQRAAHRVAALPPVENTILPSVAPPQVLPPVVADLSNGDSNDAAAPSETSVGVPLRCRRRQTRKSFPGGWYSTSAPARSLLIKLRKVLSRNRRLP